MNILDAILNAQGGAAAREAGRSVGLSQEQTNAALAALVPALQRDCIETRHSRVGWMISSMQFAAADTRDTSMSRRCSIRRRQ